MAGSLILLSDAELASPLSEVLRRHNPGLRIVTAHNGAQLQHAADTAGPFDRLIAFCTETIVPAALLARLKGPAYNVHPASPAYPGSHPASFAAYEGVTRFGATLHEMAVRVDSGPIVDVEWFDVPPGVGVLGLEDKAGEAAARLFFRLAPLLAVCPEPLPRSPLAWGPRTTTRRDFRAKGLLDPAISAEEFARRWQAFGQRDPSIMQVTLHGHRFGLLAEEPPEASAAQVPGQISGPAPPTTVSR
jgi:methionyl-tRNA formyltransferase